jgi:hypothetical protein
MKHGDIAGRDEWLRARLLSTAGIRNQVEQERRGASALLAVMGAVPDFSHSLLAGMKAPKGKVSTYTELRFKDEDQKTHIPDGAIVVERGSKRWSCLVEIKSLGQEWVRVRESVRNETLRPSDAVARAVAARWEQFVEYLCLHLSQELGVDVSHLRPRGKSAEEQIVATADSLALRGVFQCSMRVPDAVGPIGVQANLRTRRVTTTVEIPAPKEGRPRTRINWLLRQLKDAPEDLRIDVRFARVRATRSELLRDCWEFPERLLIANEPKREPRSFLLALSKPMGKKGGRTEGSFVAETRRQATDFYRDLVQGLMPPRTQGAKDPRGRVEDR